MSNKSKSNPSTVPMSVHLSEKNKAAWDTFGMFGEIDSFVKKVSSFCERQKTCSTLWMLAERSTTALNKLTGSRPDFDKNVAQGELTWPYIASPATHAIEKMKAFFKEIGLGENHSLQVDADKFNFKLIPLTQVSVSVERGT